MIEHAGRETALQGSAHQLRDRAMRSQTRPEVFVSMFRKYLVPSIAILVVALAAGCAAVAPEPAPVPPTKTPKPTFTPTPDWTPTSIVFPTFTPVEPTATPEPTATEVPPTETPVPEARLSASQNVNVRTGPSTAYPAIGRLGAGDSFVITGRNSAGDWLQFDFNGRSGWVTASLVTVTGPMDIVQVAQAPALPTAPPRPTARPVVVQPTAPPAPPAPPVSQYKYKTARIDSCRPQAGGTWFNGYVRLGGAPVNGEFCVFSWQPDGPVVASIQVGPHSGYPGWDQGYFSHILNEAPGVSRKGDWYVWIQDAGGARISEIAVFRSDGPVPEGTGCNDATIIFEG